MTSPTPGGTSSDRWRRIEKLCDGALQLEPGRRAAYLATECGPDEELRREVEALLDHERSAVGFLSAPIGAVAANVLAAPSEPDLVGQEFGDYDIVARLGAGGMGVVYRAKDRKLGREVALKVLPAAVTLDHQRLARFEREARLLATLNHPHIGAIYGLVEADGRRALALELIEGETLAAALGRSRFSIERALTSSAQIAEALDHAHRRGVTHRDLKPSNIMLTRDGVKLLDFGVGKRTPKAGDEDMPGFSTMTEEGTIVGTLHYMAPEQLEGRDADARSDLFSFGAVLYEMIAGRKAFDGPSQASVIAAILEAPTPTLNGAGVLSSRLERVVGKCLAKDPDERWQSARDLGDEIAWIADELGHPAPIEQRRRERRWRRAALASGALAVAALAVTIWTSVHPVERPGPAPTRVSVSLSPNEPHYFTGGPSLASSPDGRTLIYVLEGPGGVWLHQRSLETGAVSRIDGAGGGQAPFFSPDGQWIAFFANRRLKKMLLAGGSAVTLCELSSFIGGTWGNDGTIVFPDGATSGLFRVSSAGGSPQPLTTLRPGERSHRNPQFLPDGKAVLFTVTTTESTTYDEARIELVALDSGARQVIIEGARRAWYVNSGHLVYARTGGLAAVAFDLRERRVTGVPTPVVPGVWMNGSDVQAAISDTGVLFYLPADELIDNTRRLLWIDRRGQQQSVREERRSYLWPRISPDGEQVATVLQGPSNMLWVYHLGRNTFTRVPSEGDVLTPVWMPDSRYLLYTSAGERGEELVLQAVDASSAAQPVFASKNPIVAESVTANGRAAVVTETSPTTRTDVLVIPLQSGSRSSPFLQTAAEESGARLSPDGRWLAYVSNEAGLGRYEAYVRAFPGPGRRQQISTNGAGAVAWAASGRELFYLERGRKRMMAVDVRTDPSFSAGTPRPLFDLVGRYRAHFDVTPDGQRFVMVQESESAPPSQINVVLNWVEELKQRVHATR